MKHSNRYDIPKGHILQEELEIDCALRELQEETAILSNQIKLNPDFRFELSYQTPYKRFNNEVVEKTLVVFLAYLNSDTEIFVTEHKNYEWVNWNPPHNFQHQTIDSLLKYAQPFIL